MMRALFCSVLVFAAAVMSALPVGRAEPPAEDFAEQAPATLPIEDVTDYPSEERPVRDALREPVTMSADRVPLAKVVGQLANAHRLNFMIDGGALRNTEFKGEVSKVAVSIRPGERLDMALADMLDDVGLDYRVNNSCISISSQDKSRQTQEIRVYDVSPLVGHDASSMDVATVLQTKLGTVEAQGQGSLLIVRHHRHGHVRVLEKLNSLSRDEVRKTAESRARAAVPILLPPPPAPPRPKLPKVTTRIE